PHIDVDLTQSPSPDAGNANDQPVERKPIPAKLHFNLFLANPLTDADKQSGVPISYVEYVIPAKNPLDIMIQVDGQLLGQVKSSLFDACDRHKKGCGRMLRVADSEGRVVLRGYVTNGGIFSKTAMPKISDKDLLKDFQAMIISKKGKEVGFSLSMDNPKRTAKSNSKTVDFNRALQHQLPNVLTDDQVDELEMA
ncbi:hypothetical protein DFH28DRAFT_842050, partial [Melampsora americana]